MTEIFINKIKQWGTENTDIKSIIIVGSYAKGTNKATSDIDLIIITTNKDEMLNNQNFIELFGEVERTQTEYYGACTSVRVWYKKRSGSRIRSCNTGLDSAALRQGNIHSIK